VGAGLSLGYRVANRNVVAVHRAILRALEGHLEPADASAPSLPDTVVADYNLLARRLSSLFDEMERSQLWIISERNRNDAILRGLPCVMLAVDVDFCVSTSNDLADAFFGLPGVELRGRNLFDLLKLADEGRELLREAFLYEQQVSSREIVLGDADARRHFTLSVTFFKHSPDARDPCAVIMLQDVTDYRRLQEVTHQSEKFVAMGQLAGGVAHELNTPLGTIVGYAQLLNAGGTSEAKRAQYGQAIYNEAKRCARIIDSLLAYARKERCAPETCEINTVIRDVVATICDCRRNPYNVPIEMELRDDPHVLGGSGQLDIVLVNVITNALQAGASASPEPRVVVTSRTEGASAVVTVTDNGPGIPTGLRHRVFNPFFTTKEGNEGTGLGLAISQSIVMGIGGTLLCDSTYRDGARFILKLPLAGAALRGQCANA
jgi:signal transduction histidine kinase